MASLSLSLGGDLWLYTICHPEYSQRRNADKNLEKWRNFLFLTNFYETSVDRICGVGSLDLDLDLKWNYKKEVDWWNVDSKSVDCNFLLVLSNCCYPQLAGISESLDSVTEGKVRHSLGCQVLTLNKRQASVKPEQMSIHQPCFDDWIYLYSYNQKCFRTCDQWA